jgi:regulator of ribonuclease activity A
MSTAAPAALTAFATCDLCDLHKGDTSGAFRVLPPVFQSYGGVAKFSGPVVTVKCFEDNSLVKAAVESPGEARVLVVDAAELARCRTGIRALALMPLPTERRQEGQRDIPIQVQGVRIYPGDWLYADEDGIVVMPAPGQA